MEHKIKIDDEMSDRRRRNVYLDVKAVLGDVPIPMRHAREVTLNWHIQEELKKLMEAAVLNEDSLEGTESKDAVFNELLGDYGDLAEENHGAGDESHGYTELSYFLDKFKSRYDRAF